MGFIDWLFGRKKKASIICVGLDNSGKSTVIRHLQPPADRPSIVIPTVGFSVERFMAVNVNYTVFDMSGQEKYRTLWEHYYRDAEGIVFVVDSTDRERLDEAKKELHQILSHPDIASRALPLLVLANKMDLPEAMTSIQCSLGLDLQTLTGLQWNIVSTNALSGEGLADGLQWLAGQLK